MVEAKARGTRQGGGRVVNEEGSEGLCVYGMSHVIGRITNVQMLKKNLKIHLRCCIDLDTLGSL